MTEETASRIVTIANLAPTGEGVARTPQGVGFIAGALPGEEVEAEVLEVRKKFWKGRAVVIRTPSPFRRTGRHARGCAGCDWAGFDVEAAREAKRELFFETMERIGELPRDRFGEVSIEASGLAYRLRNRFHVGRRGGAAAVGYFAPGSHRVESAEACEALSDPLRSDLPALQEAIAGSGSVLTEISTVENLGATRRLARATLSAGADRRDAAAALERLAPLFEGVAVASGDGAILAKAAERRLWIPLAGRDFPLAAGVFFQSNRHLLGSLYAGIARDAASIPAGEALDLFGGVGLFAGALLDSGHSVVTVEANHAAVEMALAAKRRWNAEAWTLVHAEALAFLERSGRRFDIVVADPPRAGLGLPLVRVLAAGPPDLLLYVSCEIATLARDLAGLVSGGLSIRFARLYDFYPLTHRVEAVVALSPPGIE